MNTGYSSLSPEDARREVRQMKQAMRKILSSPQRARKFLISAGILEKSGKRLAAQYR